MGAFTARASSRPSGSDPLTGEDGMPAGIRTMGKLELTRRKFTTGAVKIGILASAATGAVVGFSPSAEAAVACIPGSKKNMLPGVCQQSYIGDCSNYVSTCLYNKPRHLIFTCYCSEYCGAAKCVVKCFGGAGSYRSYGCCVYC